MGEVKAVLFDLDGTLVDSNAAHVRAWQEAFRDAGVDLDAKTIASQIGKGSDMLVPFVLPGVDEQLVSALDEAHGSIFKARYLEGVTPFPRARDLLERVHESGRAVILATSSSKAEVDYYTALLDIKHLVMASTSIDDVKRSKPAPDIFSVALKKAGSAAPGEAVAVGDSPFDVQSAGNCGIATITVRSGGFSDRELGDAGALTIYDDVAALLADFDRSPLAR